MKKSLLTKIIVCGILLCVAVVILSKVVGGTAGMGKVYKNGITTYSSAQKLADSVTYNFTVPQFVLEEDNLAYKKYQGQFIEISNSRVKFCVAPYVANDVSAVGNYDDFEIDEKYTVDTNKYGINYLRYRTDGVTTVVDYFTDNIMYGLELENFDGINGKAALIRCIDIEEASMKLVNEEDGGMSYEEIN